jgi:uncharacterized protein (TIGR02145 family)
MSKLFNTKEEFIAEIKSISIDGSFSLNLSSQNVVIKEEKQYPFVKTAENLSLEEGIANLPTALRFELIAKGYTFLLDELNIDELDEPESQWRGRMTYYFLVNYPELNSKLNLQKLQGTWLSKALIAKPQIINKVDLNKLSPRAWAELIAENPDFGNQFDFSSLNTPQNAMWWFQLLTKQPQFFNKCNLNFIEVNELAQLRWIHSSINDFLKNNSKSIETETEPAPDIKIGKQVWMATNLKVTHFRNGNPIPIIGLSKEWIQASKEKKPACCFYLNDENNTNQFGLLYNWYAVSDPRGLAPNGYHIPSDKEWKTMIAALEDKNAPGNQLKSNRNEWKENASGNNNNTGFTALPAGQREEGGGFSHLGEMSFWWTSTQDEKTTTQNSPSAYFRRLNFYDQNIIRDMHDCGAGYSVRCFKDK